MSKNVRILHHKRVGGWILKVQRGLTIPRGGPSCSDWSFVSTTGNHSEIARSSSGTRSLAATSTPFFFKQGWFQCSRPSSPGGFHDDRLRAKFSHFHMFTDHLGTVLKNGSLPTAQVAGVGGLLRSALGYSLSKLPDLSLLNRYLFKNKTQILWPKSFCFWGVCFFFPAILTGHKAGSLDRETDWLCHDRAHACLAFSAGFTWSLDRQPYPQSGRWPRSKR